MVQKRASEFMGFHGKLAEHKVRFRPSQVASLGLARFVRSEILKLVVLLRRRNLKYPNPQPETATPDSCHLHLRT